MARANKQTTKERILASCVKLFLEQGYGSTTLSQIAKETGISISSFQNVFGTKDGVLLELTQIMFDSQFAAAKSVDKNGMKPIVIYAVETAIQLTLTELNENLREIYVEAYSNPFSSEYIYKRTSEEVDQIFVAYNPGLSGSDFYEMDIGSSGIMRNYMAKKCNQYFTLEKKLERFITMSFKAYNVPQKEIDEALAYVLNLDIKAISTKIMYALFESLAMQFNLEITDIQGK